MKPSPLLKCLILFVAAGVFAGEHAEPHASKPPSAHHALAEHLARTEANVKALDHHLSIAAERKAADVKNARLVERARKLARHHVRVPLLWTEYVRSVPGVVVGDEVVVRPEVAQEEAEKAAAALGDDLELLWARRRQMQAERLVLWSKIAFRAVTERELSDQPLYRFELAGQAGKALDQQRMEALKAAVQFVRVVDHLASQAQEAVDSNPQAVYVQWYKLLAAARVKMQDKMLLQALVALDVYKPDTEAGRLAADAKHLSDLAQTIVDSERALAAADRAEDDEEADASRAQLQQALADTAGAVGAMNQSVEKAAAAWAIAGVPGTKVIVVDLPDLVNSGAGPATVVAPSPGAIQPATAPAATPAPPAARTEMVGKSHSTAFQDDAPPGSILVGFDFTTRKEKKFEVINSARPVYRGATGEILGRQLGNPDGAVTRLMARPGYGVVSMEINTGLHHISGIVLHFMRINGNVAVPSDAYDASYGPHIGAGQKIGDNRPIIGLFGEAGANIDKLGLIMRN